MRLFSSAVVLLVCLYFAPERVRALTDDAPIVIVALGSKGAALARPVAREITAAAIASLSDTSADVTKKIASEAGWKHALSQKYLLITFPGVRELQVLVGVSRVPATELLVPLSPSGSYLVRNALTGEYWAFNKFGARTRAQLLCRPELRIADLEQFCESAWSFLQGD